MRPGISAIVSWGKSLLLGESLRHGNASARRKAKVKSRARRVAFEGLEVRITPATFLVVNALDGPGAGPTGSLRNAITLANQSGDTYDSIQITSSVKGTIALTAGELTISSSMDISNQSGAPIGIQQTTPSARVIEVTSSSQATQLQIAAKNAKQTITISGGSVSSGNGGGINVDNAANVLTLTHVHVVGNSAGVASSSNTAQNGGGIYSSGQVILIQSAIGTAAAPNQTSGNGGGVWAGKGVTMTGSSVKSNHAGTNGGGLYVNSANMAVTEGSSVTGNTALNGTGGGVYSASGNTSVTKSRVDGNQALNVGGINNANGLVQVVEHSEVNHNSSTAPLNVTSGNFGGGGISVGAGSVYVSQSQVSHNHSVGMYSSGIVIGLGGVTVTAGSKINWNTNRGPGGGIAANFGGVVTVSGGSQVNHNTGSGNGGGIVNFAGPKGGVRILGRSQVSNNSVTNFESLGQAIGVFLQLIAGSLGLDFTTATGGTSPSAFADEISQIETEVSSTGAAGGSSNGVSGFVVSGGGIGTLLGAPISIAGNSHVDHNLAGLQDPVGNSHTVGIGGGLFSGLGTISLKNSTVSGNTSRGAGGGVWNLGSTTVVGSTVSNNVALQSPGGGLYNSIFGSALVSRSVFLGNRASNGGGFFNRGHLGLSTSLVTLNHASNHGGGIMNLGRMKSARTVVIANSPDNIFPPH